MGITIPKRDGRLRSPKDEEEMKKRKTPLNCEARDPQSKERKRKSYSKRWGV